MLNIHLSQKDENLTTTLILPRLLPRFRLKIHLNFETGSILNSLLKKMNICPQRFIHTANSDGSLQHGSKRKLDDKAGGVALSERTGVFCEEGPRRGDKKAVQPPS